jgi:uncharacterized membrane protein
MGAVTHYLEVNVPASKAYVWWRGLTNLPTIMDDVKSVEPKSGDTKLTHWTVSGPLGKDIEWDAKIVEDVPNTRLAWASVDGTVSNAGAVRFDDHGETTGVEVSFQYDPPAGIAGDVVAKLFSDPQKKVEHALGEFKRTIEAATPDTDAAETSK